MTTAMMSREKMRDDKRAAQTATAEAELVDQLETERVDALVAMSQALRTIDRANRDRLVAERDYEQARERCDQAMRHLDKVRGNGTYVEDGDR